MALIPVQSLNKPDVIPPMIPPKSNRVDRFPLSASFKPKPYDIKHALEVETLCFGNFEIPDSLMKRGSQYRKV